MNKTLLALVLVLIIVLLTCTGCIIIEKLPAETASPQASVTTPNIEIPSITLPGSCTPTPSITEAPQSAADMYSSYAHLVSFDRATGLAQFDYFEILRGDQAVEWLVEREGKTLAEAQAIVEDFADSEFIEKNTNPKLRTIDLKTVPLKLMFYADLTMVSGAVPVESSYEDFCAIYDSKPELLLDSFFYYITVNADGSIEVEQVYWP